MSRINLQLFAVDSRKYWKDREDEALKHRITDEKEYERELKRIYDDMLDSVQKEIDAFYGKYARKEGISLSEAKKRVSELDIKAYERKAKRYVKDKDFSKQANEEMRLYNLTMKVNRLELLKANIGLELIKGHSEIEKFMAGILKGRTMDELRRQAGILGKTVQKNAKKANAIVNGSFHNAEFSDRIWMYQDIMKNDLAKLLQTGLIQGKNPRAIAKDLKKYWYGNDPRTGGGATFCMERLMRTELARVQTEAQKQAMIENGFDKYIFIVNGGCCSKCQDAANKKTKFGVGVYKVSEMMPGENASPMHPNCRCSCAAWEDDEEYEAWLDYLDKGGTTSEWNRSARALWEKSRKSPESVENTGKSSTIKSGAVSGARNPYGEKAKEHAIKYYGLVRSMKTDVAKIATTTGMSEKEIQIIKDFIFNEKHDLGGEEPEYFEPDYMMAESWRRLMEGKPEPHDITLIKHEAMERELMRQGLTQEEAHIQTSAKYNYDKEAVEFYDKIKKYKD